MEKDNLTQIEHSYQKMLIQASKGMSLITDLQKLLKLIAYIVKKYVKIRSVSIFMYDEDEGVFILSCRRGENRDIAGYKMGTNHPLITALKKKRYAVLSKDPEVRGELKRELEKLDCCVCVPSFWKGELLGFLVLGEKLRGETYSKEEVELLSTLSNGVSVAVKNAKNFMELEKIREREKENYFQTVLALAQTVDEKDSYTRGHLEYVSFYGMKVASELEKMPKFKDKINKEELETALRLHDIGKIGIPDAILYKNGELTEEEWELMRQHCEIGSRIVEPIEKLKKVAVIIKHHQERYDGKGYPDGLKGNQIPLESRIISVVDAYHAMVSDRPYRKAMKDENAIEELKKNIGTQFDPVIVKAFIRAWKKGEIRKKA